MRLAGDALGESRRKTGLADLVLYVLGLQLWTAFQLSAGLAILGIVLVVRDGLFNRMTRADALVLAALLITMLILLLPKWLGCPEFSLFQANIGDQFFYFSSAFMAMRHDFATLQNTNIGALVAMGSGVATPYNLMIRPGAALVRGEFASILNRPVPLVSYAYLQTCIFFASVFVLRNLFKLSMQFALWTAIGLTVGLFVQYVFDINAWSHLAATPLTVIFAGFFVLGLLRTPSDKWVATGQPARA
jgi:hypothetical protein